MQLYYIHKELKTICCTISRESYAAAYIDSVKMDNKSGRSMLQMWLQIQSYIVQNLVEILCELSSIVTDNASGSEKSIARRNVVRYCCRPRKEFTTHLIGSVGFATTLRIKHRVLSKESLALEESFSKGRRGSDVQFITILNSARCIFKRKTSNDLTSLSGTTAQCHIQNIQWSDFSQRHHCPMSHSKLFSPFVNITTMSDEPAISNISPCERSSMRLTSVNIFHTIRRHIPEDGYLEIPPSEHFNFIPLTAAGLPMYRILCHQDVLVRNGTSIQEDQLICWQTD